MYHVTYCTISNSNIVQFFSLKTGDEILELNGESMHGLTHYDALQKFKVTYSPSRTISVFTHNVHVNSTHSFINFSF